MQNLSRRELLQAGAGLALTAGSLTIDRAFAADKPDPYADGVLKSGEPPLPESGSFTVAVLPDTQFYSQTYHSSFGAQTKWIVDNKERRNISCVLHLGDITNNNTVEQWKVAQEAMQLLDGKLPCFLVPGNHDYGEKGRCTDRSTHLTEFFPVAKYAKLPTFGAVYDKEPDRFENSYHTFAAGGRKFLVLALEFGPRKDVVRWANEVAAKYASHEAILITHAFVYNDDTRIDWKKYGTKQGANPHKYGMATSANDDVSDGEELWQNLVSKHENFILTLNGHVVGDGLGRLVSQTPGRRNVHQVLQNFQMRPNGGDGWLRLLEFRSDGKTVQAYDYSPVLAQRNESPQNQFSMTLSKVSLRA